MVATIASAAGLRMENERLDAELRARLEELRASRARIVEAGLPRSASAWSGTSTTAPSRGCVGADAEPEAGALEGRGGPGGGAASCWTRRRRSWTQATAELRELARGHPPRRCSPTAGLVPALEALAGARPGPGGADGATVERAARRGRSRPPPTSWSPRRSPTSPSTRSAAARRGERRRRATASLTVEVSDDGSGRRRPATARACSGLADRVAALDGELQRRRERRRRHRRASQHPARLGWPDEARGRRRLGAAARGSGAPARGGRLRGRRARRATPRTCCARCRRTSRTSPIVDVRMPPTHTDEGLRAAQRDPRRAPRTSACWSSPSTSRRPTRASCSRTTPTGIGYLLKDRVADVERFADAVRARRGRRLGARPRGRLEHARPQAPRTTRWRRSPRASARSSA